MTVFRLSPEDVFSETIALLDRIKENPDDAMELCHGIWDESFCDYRDIADKDIPEMELKLAVCIVMLSLALCLNTMENFFYTRLVTELLTSINSHFSEWHDVRHSMADRMEDAADLKIWVNEYMGSDVFLSDENGNLNLLANGIKSEFHDFEAFCDKQIKSGTHTNYYITHFNGTVNGDAHQNISLPQQEQTKKIAK